MNFSSFWRTITAWSLGIILTLVLIPVGLVAFVLDPVRQRLVQPIIRFWGRSIMRFCFIPVTVTGRENALKVPAAVFVSNHQSMLDIFTLLGYIPRNSGFLAKKQVIWVPIIGWLLLIFGHVRVDRSNPRRSLESVQRCIKAIKSGWSIIIFPEGTRSCDGSISPFKSGSLKIPLRTGAPVVPVTIAGAYNVMPKKTMSVHPHPIFIHIGEPVSTDGLDVKDFKAFVQDIEDKIRDTYKRITSEHPETAPTAES